MDATAIAALVLGGLMLLLVGFPALLVKLGGESSEYSWRINATAAAVLLVLAAGDLLISLHSPRWWPEAGTLLLLGGIQTYDAVEKFRRTRRQALTDGGRHQLPG